MQGLDLIAVQKKVRELKTARQLFQMWNAVCRLHDRGQINMHELDEIQIVICSQFKEIERVNSAVELSRAA